MNDVQYDHLPRPSAGMAHRYGPRVRLLSYPWPMSLLARLCDRRTVQPEINRLVRALYHWMLGEVASHVLETGTADVTTRMGARHPEGVYRGEVIADQRVVVVDIARAGILPASIIYEVLHHVISADNLRQDHIIASRTTGHAGEVTGVRIDVSKVGGPVDDATVLIPDPMGATGSSITAVLDHYRTERGKARRFVAMHLIVTPEYLARMAREFPGVDVFAIRLDRGLSAPDVLRTVPGERWEAETGLNEHQYIVPGAGGVGELLNNTWV